MRLQTQFLARALLALPLLAAITVSAQAATDAHSITLAGQGLDVGLVVSDIDRAAHFYGTVLGLPEQSAAKKPGPSSTRVFNAGASSIRLHQLSTTSARVASGVMATNGIRLMAILLRGPEALAQRFAAAGLPAPQLTSMSAGNERFQFGFASDPDGNAIELVVFDDASAAPSSGFQIGLTVSDAERARDFYGNVLGMIERPAVPLPPHLAKDTMQYMFRANATTIKFWAPPTPRDSPSDDIDAVLGIRYISIPVADLNAAQRALIQRGARILTERSLLRDSARRVFIADPDGNRIEIVEAR